MKDKNFLNPDDYFNENTIDTLKTTATNLEGLTGGILLGNAYLGGHLTGRETLWHGTTADRKKSILEKGILPTTEENSVLTKNVLGGTKNYAKGFGKAYLARNPWEAYIYAANANAAEKNIGNGLVNAVIDGLINNKSRKNLGIVHVNAPTWKMKVVPDPMYDMPFEEFLKDREANREWQKKNKIYNLGLRDILSSYNPNNIFGKAHKKILNAFNNFKDRAVYDTGGKYVVVEGGVPTKYIKGSKDYQGLTLDEFKEYVSKNKGRFAGGIAKALIGGGMLGHAIYNTVNRFKENAKRRKELGDDRSFLSRNIDEGLGAFTLADKDKKLLEKYYDLPEDANIRLRHIGRIYSGALLGEAAGALGGYGLYRALRKPMPTTARLLMLPATAFGESVGISLANQKYSKDNVIRIENEMKKNNEKYNK